MSVKTTPARSQSLHTVSLVSNNTDKILIQTEYTSTTILLDSEDSSFVDTLVLTEATSSGLTTSDNGKTWTVDTININEHTFDL